MKKGFLHQERATRFALIALLLSVIGTMQLSAQNAPEGAINGLFTTDAEGGKVYFSQGNLQYQASTDTWRFAENQYDFVGQANMYISETNEGWIDLFGWATSGHAHGGICYQPWSTGMVGTQYQAYGSATANLEDQTGEADWGCNPISNGGNEANLWRTLTKDEWVYVFNTRYTASGIRYAKATVNDVKGVILLPNSWDASIYTLNGANTFTTTYGANVISESDWSTLEAAGVVFLPAAGQREGQSPTAYSQTNSTNGKGRYWSSTCHDPDDAYFVSIIDASLNPKSLQSRHVGHSVRLVKTTYTVTYNIEAEPNPETGGTVQGDGVYDGGDLCTLTATANEGYTFVNWTENGEEVSTSETYSFTVTGDASFVANFQLNSYEITATANPEVGGTVSGMGIYNHFDTCTLVATANEGYDFAFWMENGVTVSYSDTYTFTVTGESNFVAFFVLKSYEINVSANPLMGGIVSGDGTYSHGDIVTLTATPNNGYGFVNWTKGGTVVSTDATYTFTATEDADFVANFQFTSYIITARANPNVGGVVTGDGIYEEGDLCTLTATANENYTFVKWTKNGTLVSTEPTLTFNVTESAFYIASFTYDLGIVQSSEFPTGWNWWSTYVETENDYVLNQLETGFGNNGITIKSANGYVSYIEYGEFSIWYGSPGFTINNETSYKIQVAADCHVDITGNPIDPADYPISLSYGWNWIGYPCNYTMDVTTAFSGFTPTNGDQVKSGNVYANYIEYGGTGIWYGSLDTIRPGMGMMYNSKSGTPITFVYPEVLRSTKATKAVQESSYWQPNLYAYPDNMTVTAVVELDGEEVNTDNYELAVFANGECRGTAKLVYVEPVDRYMAFLTVHGEDVVDLSFGLYDSRYGVERYDADNFLVYSTNAIVGSLTEPYVIRFRGVTGIDECDNSLHVFPNPVSRGESLSLGMMDNGREVLVETINALGAVISTETLTKLPVNVMAPSTPGIYTLRITVEGKGTYYRKLVVR